MYVWLVLHDKLWYYRHPCTHRAFISYFWIVVKSRAKVCDKNRWNCLTNTIYFRQKYTTSWQYFHYGTCIQTVSFIRITYTNTHTHTRAHYMFQTRQCLSKQHISVLVCIHVCPKSLILLETAKHQFNIERFSLREFLRPAKLFTFIFAWIFFIYTENRIQIRSSIKLYWIFIYELNKKWVIIELNCVVISVKTSKVIKTKCSLCLSLTLCLDSI